MPRIQINVAVHDSCFIKDPLETALGQRIIRHSIELFHEVGYEQFNFKKLSERIGSPEASVYRYFENKYRLLTYLVSWYWDFMHYMILLDTRNIDDPKRRIRLAFRTLVTTLHEQEVPDYINQEKLHLIVVNNATKVYHSHKVDELKEKGFYQNYQKLVNTISNMILAIDPNFKYPKAIATNLLELALSNEYNLEHFPELTDEDQSTGDQAREKTEAMIAYMLSRILDPS